MKLIRTETSGRDFLDKKHPNVALWLERNGITVTITVVLKLSNEVLKLVKSGLKDILPRKQALD